MMQIVITLENPEDACQAVYTLETMLRALQPIIVPTTDAPAFPPAATAVTVPAANTDAIPAEPAANEEKPVRQKRSRPKPEYRNAEERQQALLASDGISDGTAEAEAPAPAPEPAAAQVVEAPVSGGDLAEADVIDAVKGYVGANGARVATIAGILGEFGVRKVSELKAKDRAAFVAKVTAAA